MAVEGRHDRTRLFISGLVDDGEEFFGRPVLIAAEPGALRTFNGRIALDALVRTVSRFSDNLGIRLPREYGRLERRMERLAGLAGARAGPCPEPEVTVSVGGRAEGRFGIAIGSSGWVSRVRCRSGDPLGFGPEENVVGAMGSACLGAAEAFKRLVEVGGCSKPWARRHPEKTSFSFLDYTFSESGAGLAARADVGEVLLVGAGAVGSAFLYAASKARIRGTIDVLDHDTVDVTNLNRHLPFHLQDVGRPKAEAAEQIPSESVRIRGHATAYGAYGRRGAHPVVVSAVDNDEARFEIQHDLPRLILHGATGREVAAASSVKLLENACLCCIFHGRRGRAEAISRDAGIPLPLVQKALRDGGKFTAEHLAWVRRKHGGTRLGRADLGRTLEDIYSREICGTVRADAGGARQPTAPFVSFFSGLALLAELVKESDPALGAFPMKSGPDFVEISLFSPQDYRRGRRAKNPRCGMRCADPAVREIFERKWGGPAPSARDRAPGP